MANAVDIAIRGIDEATQVFENVGSSAQKSMEQAEESVKSVDDSIENVSSLNIDTSGAESAMSSASGSIEGVEQAIQETGETGQKFGDKMKGVFSKVSSNWKKITAVAGSTGVAFEGFSRTQGEVNSKLKTTSIATGISSDALRDMAENMTDGTMATSEAVDGFDLLVQKGFDTQEQLKNILPEVVNLSDATGKDLPDAMDSADSILRSFGGDLSDLGDNTDQFSRIMTQTDIPLGSLQRNLGRVPDELQGLKFGLDDASAGIKVFKDRGFESKEAIREFRRAVEDSDGNMKDFLDSIGLTNDEWEEYQQKVEPSTDLTNDLAQANLDSMTTMEKMNNVVGNLMTKYGSFAELLGMLAPILIALGPAIKGVSMAMKVFNMVLRMNPIGLIITGITALIAVIILLWKNWDTVSQFLQQSWQMIKQVAMTVFGAIGSFLSTVWQKIKSVIMTVWNAIKSFFNTIWNGIVAVVKTYIQTYKTIITTVFNAIKSIITSIWNGIKSFFSTIWSAIVKIVTTYINNVKANIQKVFNVIKTIVTSVWNAIKSVSSSVWNSIISVVTGIINRLKSGIRSGFNLIKSVITSVWNAIRSVSSSVWNGIRGAVVGVVGGIRSAVSSSFHAIRSVVTSVWNGIKSSTSRVWNSMVGIVKAPINMIIGAINGMISGINSIHIKSPKIPSWVPKFGGKSFNIGFNIPHVPSLATGGVLSSPTLAMVGDAGAGNPEIVAPQKMIASIVAEELRKVLNHRGGNTGDNDSNIHIHLNIDGEEISSVIAPKVDRYLGNKRRDKMRAEGDIYADI